MTRMPVSDRHAREMRRKQRDLDELEASVNGPWSPIGRFFPKLKVFDWHVVLPPGPAPHLVCWKCADLWAKGIRFARAESARERRVIHEGRAIVCVHGEDPERLNIAFIVRGVTDADPTEWIGIRGVKHSDWNEVYEGLVLSNARRYIMLSEACDLALNVSIARGVAAAQAHRHWLNAKVAGAAALLLMMRKKRRAAA